MRAAHTNNGRPSQPRFGQKVVQGKLETHATEQRVVDAVRQMNSEGMGFRQIARTFNQLKIPTKCRGKSWHPEMVSRIVKFSD
jgi:hypothetical protein